MMRRLSAVDAVERECFLVILSFLLCRVVGANESLVNLLLYLISKKDGGDDFFFFFTNMGMDGSCWVGLGQIVRPCGRI